MEKLCEKCGILIPNAKGNTRYCEFCKVDVKKEMGKKRVQKHIEKTGREEWNEKSREAMERYRDKWGWDNKNECLGSGRLSPKMNKDPDIEGKLIRWEMRRLGIL